MAYLSLKKENNWLKLAYSQLKLHWEVKAKLEAVKETPTFYSFRQTILNIRPRFYFKWNRATKEVLRHRLDLSHI